MRQSTKKQLAVLLDFDFDFPEIKYVHELQNIYYYNSKFKELISDEKIKEFIGMQIKK